ncbi:hypothetical protein PybrP1_005006 [[Pythium] brassicae (nom. inval.)]|nr:hypothetical protein PybrP1_005006 [[Pythium] brassicae (nom. inval.)]
MSGNEVFIFGIGGLILICSCIAMHNRSEVTGDSLRAPLLKDADGVFKRCRQCGLDNFKRLRFCCLCGDKVYEELRHIDARRPLPAWATLSQRQKRARLRIEWQRRMDAQGTLYWFRTSRSKTTRTNTKLSPGYALRFVEDAGAVVAPLDAAAPLSPSARASMVTIELIPPETEPASVSRSDESMPAERDLEQGAAPDDPARPQALEKVFVRQMIAIEAALQTPLLVSASEADPSIPTVAALDVDGRAAPDWKNTNNGGRLLTARNGQEPSSCGSVQGANVGFEKRRLCGFENFKRLSFCSLCGATLENDRRACVYLLI